jgi:hypothetical protein
MTLAKSAKIAKEEVPKFQNSELGDLGGLGERILPLRSLSP